jgi:hypothetical protein
MKELNKFWKTVEETSCREGPFEEHASGKLTNFSEVKV